MSGDGPDLVEKVLRCGSARLSGTPEAYAREQPIPSVDDLFRVDPKVAKHIAEHAPERLYAFVASIRLTVGSSARQVELNMGIHRCEGRVPVAAVIGRCTALEA